MRIPMKWGTDSGASGAASRQATLVRAMIAEVPQFSQDFCAGEGNQHHFVSIISFLFVTPFQRKWGTHSDPCGAAFRN
jgi:hypothetical protein